MSQRRAPGVGGTRAAAIAGLSPYKTPLEAWKELVGETSGKEFKTSPAILWGTILETPIREFYCAKNRCMSRVPTESIKHPEHGWKHATPDALVANAENPTWGLEIKTAGARSAKDWGPSGGSAEDIPPVYRAQCAWYMHVCDHERWDVAVLIGGQDYREYILGRDRQYEDWLVGTVTDFYNNYVVPRIQPPAPKLLSSEVLAVGWENV